MKNNLLYAVALFIGLATAGAQADTLIGTPISRLPATISKPGKYRLAKDLSISGSAVTAISITTSNVVLDMNGFTLTGTAAGSVSTAINITGSYVTVRNGSIIGFGTAVTTLQTGSEGPQTMITVENLDCDSQTNYVALFVQATNAVIRCCRVTNSIGVTGPEFGIASNNSGVVVDCIVSGLKSSGNQITGIAIADIGSPSNNAQVVCRCVVSNLTATASQMGVVSGAESTVIDDCSFYNLNTPTSAAAQGVVIVKNCSFRACGTSFKDNETVVIDGGNNTIVP